MLVAGAVPARGRGFAPSGGHAGTFCTDWFQRAAGSRRPSNGARWVFPDDHRQACYDITLGAHVIQTGTR